LTRRNIGPASIREFWESLLSKLANRLGRSIAKLRNTHVLNVIVTGGTQQRLFHEGGPLMHRTAPMTLEICRKIEPADTRTPNGPASMPDRAALRTSTSSSQRVLRRVLAKSVGYALR
jgi:hypothetical protein